MYPKDRVLAAAMTRPRDFEIARDRRLREAGLSDAQVRDRLASDLGHGQREVPRSYVAG